jgi:hypothetical protein
MYILQNIVLSSAACNVAVTGQAQDDDCWYMGSTLFAFLAWR